MPTVRKLLDDAGAKHAYHIGVGDGAEVIAHDAKNQRIEQLAMGAWGMGLVPNLMSGSVATKVIHLTDILVLLVKYASGQSTPGPAMR